MVNRGTMTVPEMVEIATMTSSEVTEIGTITDSNPVVVDPVVTKLSLHRLKSQS